MGSRLNSLEWLNSNMSGNLGNIAKVEWGGPWEETTGLKKRVETRKALR